MLLSIIIPSYNQSQFIRRTIESVLEQDYRAREIIVIDGESTDGTIEVLRDYDDTPEVKWISEPDSGVVEAINKGFARASGVFGAIQSSDDYYQPGAISTAIQELVENPELGFVYGDVEKVDAAGKTIQTTHLGAFTVQNVLSLQTWIPQPSTFFRMDLAKELGGWRESVPYAADTDLWYRMMLKAGARKVHAVWAKRRVHGEQRDLQGERIIRDYAQVIEDLFERFGAPADLRPAAEAGLLLMKNRYGYGEPSSIKQARLEEAIRRYAPLADYLRTNSRPSPIDRLRSLSRKVRLALAR